MVDGIVLSYKKLWKLLVDKGITGTQLREQAGVTTTVMSKMNKEEPVHLEALMKICKVLNCTLSDIVDVVPQQQD